MKRCSKCGETKNIEEFSKKSKTKDGLSCWCRSCANQANKLAYNPESKKQKYLEDRETRLAYFKKYHRDHKEEISTRKAVYRENNKERISQKKKDYVERNKEKVAAAQKTYQVNRRKTDEGFRVLGALRSRLQKAAKGFRDKTTKELLGCSFQDLLTHLGQKPTENSHIDHICPCAQAQNEQELLKLQHYTNLRWLPAEENLKKSDNKTPEAEEMCKKLLDREWID